MMRQIFYAQSGWQQTVRFLVVSIFIVICSTLVMVSPARATGVYDMPGFSADTWIIDEAGILSFSTEGKLTTELQALAEETGYDVRFVTLHRLDYGETAQSFADDLFEQWFPTPDDQAKQTLLVIDNVTNNTGIRTGDQVKTMVSDAIADSIAHETMLAPLKHGNKYNQAFLDASDRLSALLSGNPDPGAPSLETTLDAEGNFASPEETKSSNAGVWVIVLLIVSTVIPMATWYYFYR